MPIHVFWGGEDRVLPSRHAEFFRRALPPHAIVEVAGGYGHAPYVDDLSGFTARIARFAMSCRPASEG
jgi:pimeloyl-ACP methyl ester carboxylesterase